MNYSNALPTGPGVAYSTPIEKVWLEQPADSDSGDEQHRRHRRSSPPDLSTACVQLTKRLEANAAAIKALEGAFKDQKAAADTEFQLAPEQDAASRGQAFLVDVEQRRLLNANLISGLHDLRDTAAAVDQQMHLLEANLRESAAIGVPDTPEARKLVDDAMVKLHGELPPLAREGLNQPNASSDFFDQLLAMIGQIRGEYLAVYEELLKKYSDFYAEFNKEIMAEMNKWIRSQPDGKHIELNRDFLDAIESLINKYAFPDVAALFPISGTATKAEAEKWALALGMGENSPNVKEFPLGSGQFYVMMDLSPLHAMVDQLYAIFNKGDRLVNIDSAKFQAWQAGFNTQEQALKNKLQVFTTKYGNANSYHENFNKILSSQLSQYAEMLKAIVSGIA